MSMEHIIDRLTNIAEGRAMHTAYEILLDF